MSQLSGQPPTQLPAAFGRYRLLQLLGKGGMGSVYLAHDTQLDRRVALKIPQLNAAEDEPVLDRFYTEARAAAALNHPNICPIHDVGQIGGIPYLTMAYVEGKPLGELTAGRPLPPRQSAVLVRKLALALDEAHRRGVIHRDLKAANIMIDRRGEPVVMDFGLARRARRGDPRMTQEGAALGTPAYMPPEQVQGLLDAMGPASDVYSLGVVLYELLAGRLPFQGDVMAMLSKVLLEEPAPPSRFRPDVEPQLERICLKAMARKIEDRYPSMAELAGCLLDYLRGKASLPETAQRGKDEVPAHKSGRTSPPVARTVPPPGKDTEPEGIRVSQMGGLRSVAQLHAQAPPTEKTHGKHPRRRRRRETASLLPLWVGLGAAAILLAGIVGIAWIVYRATDYGTIRLDLGSADREVAIQVDGVDQPADSELRLRAGPHVLSVSGKDYEPEQYPFTVRRGSNPDLKITLRAKRPPPTGAAVSGPVPATPPAARPALELLRRSDWPTEGVVFGDAAARGRYFLASRTHATGRVRGVRVWDGRSGQVLWEHNEGTWARFSPSGELVYKLEDENPKARVPVAIVLRAYRTATGQFVRNVFRSTKFIFSIYLSADGRYIIAQHQGSKAVWSVADRKWVRDWRGDGGFAPDGKHLVIRFEGENRFRRYRLPGLEEVPAPQPPPGFDWVYGQPAGQYAIAGEFKSPPEAEWLIEAEGRKMHRWLPRSYGKVIQVEHWINRQESLVTLEDGSIRVFDVVTQQERSCFRLPQGEQARRIDLSLNRAFATVVTNKGGVLLFRLTGPPANDKP